MGLSAKSLFGACNLIFDLLKGWFVLIMKDFHLRKLPDTTFAFLKDRADEANVSINKYIIAVLNQHAVLPEIQAVESKFSELAKVTVDVLESNNQLFKQIIKVLEGVED